MCRFSPSRGLQPGLLLFSALFGLCESAVGPARASGRVSSAAGSGEEPDSAADGVWTRHTIDRSSRGADGVRLADVDRDGRLDVVTGWEEGGRVRVYLQPPASALRRTWPAVTVGEVRSPEDAVFVDVDGDGAVDVVSSCEGRERTMFIHWAPSARERFLDAKAWKTDAIPVTRNARSWMFTLPMDVDGRHGIDLVTGSKGGGAVVGWLEAPATPRSVAGWKHHVLRPAGWIMSIRTVDLDADEDPDILVSDRRGERAGVFWLENPGVDAVRRGAKWTEHAVGEDLGEVMFLDTGDLDGDGRRDIVCAVKGRGIAYLRATGVRASPWSVHRVALPPGCGTAKAVAIGDVDVDGRRDIVFSCEGAKGERSGMRWMSFDGSATSGRWRDHEIGGPEGVKFDRIELVDLDGDGDPDVVSCEERDNLGVFWYENPPRGG